MNSQLLTWIVSLGAWNWFILAALLFLLEILAPGSFMLWLALSAILVGAISTAVVWSWQAQLIASTGSMMTFWFGDSASWPNALMYLSAMK